jgi:hypothetical protein
MLPDDVFRSRLESTITALRYWAPSVADAARLDEKETGDYWRLKVMPRVASACPFDLILHMDQRYDIVIAGENYESRPIETFEWFVPFADAVAEGNIVQRRWISRFTGMERAIETVVTLPGGSIWREENGNGQGGPVPMSDDGAEVRERRFLPYRRR